MSMSMSVHHAGLTSGSDATLRLVAPLGENKDFKMGGLIPPVGAIGLRSIPLGSMLGAKGSCWALIGAAIL